MPRVTAQERSALARLVIIERCEQLAEGMQPRDRFCGICADIAAALDEAELGMPGYGVCYGIYKALGYSDTTFPLADVEVDGRAAGERKWEGSRGELRRGLAYEMAAYLRRNPLPRPLKG